MHIRYGCDDNYLLTYNEIKVLRTYVYEIAIPEPFKRLMSGGHPMQLNFLHSNGDLSRVSSLNTPLSRAFAIRTAIIHILINTESFRSITLKLQ